MTSGHKGRAAACALAAVALALTALAFAAPAGAGLLEPRGKKVWFGVSDTGDPADFGAFSEALDKHPAVIESFRNWGSDFPESIRRWQTARARPMIHVTTADNNDGHEILTPQAIAEGGGDDYLIRLNRLFSEKDMRGYLRPLGEPNRCLNVYAAYDCGGSARGGRPHAALVQARLPPLLRDRPRRRQGEGDQPPPRRSRPAAAQRHRRRPAEGAGGDHLEPAPLRLAHRPPQPPPPLLARLALGRLGRHRLLRRLPGMEVARPASTTATRTSPSP